jgi:hypothetical protein
MQKPSVNKPESRSSAMHRTSYQIRRALPAKVVDELTEDRASAAFTKPAQRALDLKLIGG